MSLKTWWQQKSGFAKTLTALVVALLLQIGLCFSSPLVYSGYHTLFPRTGYTDPWGGVAMMIVLALTSGFTAILFIVTLIVGALMGSLSGDDSQPQPLFDKNQDGKSDE